MFIAQSYSMLPVAESLAQSYLPGEDSHVGESATFILNNWKKR
jgi:hypothetical protein